MELEHVLNGSEAHHLLYGNGKTNRQRFLKAYDLEDHPYSLQELSDISHVPLVILKQVYDRGMGAVKTQPQSVRLKHSYVKNVRAPRSAKLSPHQWASGRTYSFLMGGPHDEDLRRNLASLS